MTMVQLLWTGSHRKQSWSCTEQGTVPKRSVEGTGLCSSRKGLPAIQGAQQWGKEERDAANSSMRCTNPESDVQRAVKAPNLSLCRNETPKSSLSAEKGVQDVPSQAAAPGLLPGHPSLAAEEVGSPGMAFPASTPGSCAGTGQGLLPRIRSLPGSFPRSPGQQTANQPLSVPSSDPAQGACERSSRSQVSLCFYFPRLILSGSKGWVSNAASPSRCSPPLVPAELSESAESEAVGTSQALKAAPGRFPAGSCHGIAGTGGNALLLWVFAEKKKKKKEIGSFECEANILKMTLFLLKVPRFCPRTSGHQSWT